MPVHTISPTIDSQGLGITYSTLSPQQYDQSAGPSRPIQTLTGMGVHPRSTPGPSSSHPSQNNHPTHAGQAAPLRAGPPRQSSSQGFASFSDLAPAQAGQRPPGPRRLPSTPQKAPVVDERSQQSQPERAASRAGSIASSKQITRTKSMELFRKFSRSETVAGGRYVPLSGEDDGPVMGQASDNRSEIAPSFQPTPSSIYTTQQTQASGPSQPDLSANVSRTQTQLPVRTSTVSSSATTSGSSEAQSMAKTPSDNTHAFHPRNFPYPPDRALSRASHSQRPLSQMSGPPTAYFMPRSNSQPHSMHSGQQIPEAHLQMGYTSSQLGAPHHDKRASSVASGIHSRNAALFSAEAGGVMLEFSPSGHGMWKEGQEICGAQTGLIPTPHQVQPSRMAFTADDSDIQQISRSRPWSTSFPSQQEEAPLARPPTLRQHGRSHSDGAAVLARQGTLFHPAGSTKRASQELGVMLGGKKSRRVSQPKLLTPPDLGGEQQVAASQVRLEASKKSKARVEVDVVLERDCVVEGGEVRGRMEVRVTAGKRSAGLRVGAGKIRVLGFEDISPSSRHIFYHHTHDLPLFAHPAHQSGPQSSLFASAPDDEGYCVAAEGSHNLAFNLRLPMNAGAKGSYDPPTNKGPCVKYVVVGSVKIHIPQTGKRSIAHFYRTISILPFLDPGRVLAPHPEPVEARIQKGLGWSLGGEKGKVDLRVALGRKTWISGQKLWCEVGIINNSAKKIKSLSLALLETVQTFVPQPGLDTQRSRNQQVASKYLQQIDSATPEIDACKTHTSRRKLSEEIIEADFASKGAGRVTGKGWWVGVEAGDVGRWDMSLMLPPGLVTIRRSRLMEVVYTLRVTVNGSIYVDMPVELINFLSIDPAPMPSDGVRGANPMVAMHQQHVVSLNGGPYINASRPAHTRILSDGTVQTRRSMDTSGDPAKASSTTLHIDQLLQAGRARAEAEAQGLAGAQLPASSSQYRQRPLSMGSDYAELHDGFNQDHVFPPAKASASGLPSSTSQAHRPGHMRALSYLSTRTAETEESNNTDHEGPETLKDQDGGDVLSEDDDNADKAMAAARRAQGRQRSLAALGRAMDRAAAADEEEIERAEAVRNNLIPEADLLSPMEEKEFNPFGMPTEEEIKLVNDTPSMRAMSTPHLQSTASSRSKMRRPSVIESLKEELSEEREGPDPDQHIEGGIESLLPGDALGPSIVDHGDEYPDGEGDDTVIQELLVHHSPEVYSDDQRTFPSLSGESGGYDYAEEIEEESDPQLVRSASQPELRKRKSLPRQLPKLSVINPRLSIPNLNRSESHYGGEASDEEDESDDGSREDSQEVPQTEPGSSVDRTRHIANARSVNGSVALSSYSVMTGGSEAESEVGQVLEAIKRNFSIKATESKDGAETPAETSSDHGPTAESQRYLTVDSISRRGKDDLLNASIKSRSSGRSSYLPPASGLGMRRESSNPPIPSPLRPKQGEDDTPVVRLVKKKSAVDLAIGDAEPGSGNAKVIQKKSSFSFATPKSPIRIRTTSSSVSRSPSKTPGGAKSALQNTRRPSVASGISPKSSAPGQLLNVSPRLSEPSGDFGRQSSPASSLRHAIQPDVTPTRHDDTSESEELDVPALAPSLAPGSASESGSSDGHALISPPGNTDSHGMLPAIADTLLPKPNGVSKTDLFNDYTIRKNSDQLPSAIVWGTSEHLLHPQVNLLSATIPDDAAAGKGSTYTHRPSLSRASSLTEDHAREYIDDSNSVMSHGSSHSSVLLPGVKSKIAQMESRDEALRKFSVVSALSAHQPRSGSVTSPVPASPVRTPRASEALQYASSAPLGASPKSPTGSGRKSYTTALAPRPSRSTSEDLYSKSTMSPPSKTARQQTMPVAPSPMLRAKVSSPSEQEWSPRRAIYGSPPSFSLPELNVVETAGNGINQRMELGDELDPFGLKGRTGSGTGSSGGRPDSRAGGEGSPRLKVRSTLRDSTGSNNTTLTAIESALASVAKYRNIGAGNASPQSMTSRHHSNVPDHGHGSGDSPLRGRLPAASGSRGDFITLDTPDGRERSQYFGDLLASEGDGRTRASRAWSRVTAETEESEGLL